MAASTAELRRSLSSDQGQARTLAMASVVGVMIVAAVAALILVSFDHSGKSHSAAGTQPSASDVGRQSTPSVSATTSAPAVAPATSTSVPAPASSSATLPKASASATKATKATIKPARKSMTSPSAKTPATYIVKHGDNLTVIAAWFHQHGYTKLYDWNRSVIGRNPNLIFPGQKITITDGKVRLH